MNVLAPTDFSESAEAAVSAAVTLARRVGGKLTLFHAYPMPAPYSAGYWPTSEFIGAVERDAQRKLEETRRVLFQRLAAESEGSALEIDLRVAIGEPARAIVDEAKRGAYDLVVIGTHGRSGFAHLFLGSVAEKVVRSASCPVVTVRHPRASKPVEALEASA